LRKSQAAESRRSSCPGCSTPFGITEEITYPVISLACRSLSCSTPFGITEEITAQPIAVLIADCPCSTPFGITEEITSGEWEVGIGTLSAQRLSASLRKSRPGNVAKPCGAKECSTPFGITEEITSPHQRF